MRTAEFIRHELDAWRRGRSTRFSRAVGATVVLAVITAAYTLPTALTGAW
jgi:hypothetical protein